MKSKTRISIFLFLFSLLACHKDNQEVNNKALLQGTWQLQNSITQTSITNNYNGATNPPVVTSDTIIGGTADVNAALVIEGDSVSYSSYFNQSVFAVSGATYVLHDNSIAFSNNLLSSSSNPLVIQTLTSHQLTLLDHDTTNFVPLVTHEYLSTYTK